VEKKEQNIAFNRKAKFEYQLQSSFHAGLILKGTEIKSIRLGRVSISEAYCAMQRGELYVKGMNIQPYESGGFVNHEPVRDRKLLLTRSEIKKIERRIHEKGMTLVPIRLFISERGHAKLEVALAEGKRKYDKRDTIKDRDQQRDLNRLKKIKGTI
jgi:SsrA-binding protein